MDLLLTSKKWSPRIQFLFKQELPDNMRQLIQSDKLIVSDHETKQNQKDQQSKQIKSVIDTHQTVMGEQVYIMKMWIYKTPLSDKQWTSLLFHHQYIILQLLIDNHEIKYCCLEKTLKGLYVTFSDSFQFLRDNLPTKRDIYKKRVQSQYWKPLEIEKFTLYCDFYELVRFLYQNNENKKTYNVLKHNCQQFCLRISTYLKKFILSQ